MKCTPIFSPVELTEISPEVLVANNARPFREVWPRFVAWLILTSIGVEWDGDKGCGGIVLAAHNAKFDIGFLLHEVARAGFGSRFVVVVSVSIEAVVSTLLGINHTCISY